SKRVILTHAHSVRDALKEADVPYTNKDTVEPKPESELVATNYVVNIYRARPVIVVDGAMRQKIMTAAQTPHDIVAATDITPLRDEDQAMQSTSGDIVADGASTVLTIDRAVPFTLLLYGVPTPTYTHASSVGEMLEQKGVKLALNDTLSAKQSDALTAGMTVSIWRNGVQTATVDEPVAFPIRQVRDVDQPMGYHQIQTPGINGSKSVTYEITAQGGKEVSRKAIQSVTLVEPKEQVEIVGAKPGNGLTKSKGADVYTDSKGLAHRETYYDLNMGAVMSYCGGGTYTIRSDGAKIDKDGYVLVAAHLGNHPRCSIVETSIGLGKVYDTGSFTSRYPQAYDLATDWTNSDGR
ncbi:MAG: ubiquitin-like domain-containing protein, partial [Patescibacteria group bacterium]